MHDLTVGQVESSGVNEATGPDIRGRSPGPQTLGSRSKAITIGALAQNDRGSIEDGRQASVDPVSVEHLGSNHGPPRKSGQERRTLPHLEDYVCDRARSLDPSLAGIPL